MAAGEISAHRKLTPPLGESKPGWDIAHTVLRLFEEADYQNIPQERIDLASITITIDAGHVIVKAKLQER